MGTVFAASKDGVMEVLCKVHRDKVSHKTRRDAQAALRLLKEWRRYDGHVYRCHDCNGYHVGRPNRRVRRKKFRRADDGRNLAGQWYGAE